MSLLFSFPDEDGCTHRCIIHVLMASKADFSDPEGIRTLDPQIRNLLLYPAELRDPALKSAANVRKNSHLPKAFLSWREKVRCNRK